MRKKRFWFAALLGLFIFYYTIRQADLTKLSQNIHDIDLVWGIFTLSASALSYICIGAVLYLLLRSMGHTLSFRTSFRIALVSTTLNYIMAMGGLSGMAAKVYLLSRERVPPSSI